MRFIKWVFPARGFAEKTQTTNEMKPTMVSRNHIRPRHVVYGLTRAKRRAHLIETS